MCFSCKTYDIVNPPTDEHLCNNKRKCESNHWHKKTDNCNFNRQIKPFK